MSKEELKWHYDKKFKQWWTDSDNGDFTIEKDAHGWYDLSKNNSFVHYFKRLKSAKEVARLMYYG